MRINMQAYLVAYDTSPGKVAKKMGTYRQQVEDWASRKNILVTCDKDGNIELVESLKLLYKRE